MTQKSFQKTPDTVIMAEANRIAIRNPNERRAFADSVRSRHPNHVWKLIWHRANAMMERRNVSW